MDDNVSLKLLPELKKFRLKKLFFQNNSRVKKRSKQPRKNSVKKKKRTENNVELSDSPFKFNCFINDDVNKKKPIYAVKFNPLILNRNIFAAAATGRILMLECVESNPEESEEADDENEDKETKPNIIMKNCGIKVLKIYEADDSLYALEWSYDTRNNNSPVLNVAGEKGVIRTIFAAQDSKNGYLIGHSKL